MLPVVYVEADTLPEAWERAVIETWERGTSIKTQYDKPGDPLSKDATAVIVVRYPFKEPRIHKAIPCGLDGLYVYVQEVLRGVHDHWISPNKWQYTYHERLENYTLPDNLAINQIEVVIEKLAEVPYTRRAQAITWKPWLDNNLEDPPCLQRLWFRIFEADGLKLVMNAHMRSNDAFKAAFMNMYAFTEIQRYVAEKVSEKLGEKVEPGQYIHIADSFHTARISMNSKDFWKV